MFSAVCCLHLLLFIGETQITSCTFKVHGFKVLVVDDSLYVIFNSDWLSYGASS